MSNILTLHLLVMHLAIDVTSYLISKGDSEIETCY